MTTELVVQSNDLIRAQYKISLLAKKFICKAIARLNPKAKKLSSIFSLQEFAEDLCLSDPNLIYRIQSVFHESSSVKVKLVDKEQITLTVLVHRIDYDKSSQNIEVFFSDPLKDHLLDLKEKYTSYVLKNIISLNSQSHIRLYELLSSYAYKKEFVISMNELITMFKLPASYSEYNNLKRRFLLPAQESIMAKTDMRFNFNPIKVGKKVTEIEFEIFAEKIKEDRELWAQEYEFKGTIPDAIIIDEYPLPSPVLPSVNKVGKKDADIQELFDYYVKKFNKTSTYKLTEKRKGVVRARLKEGFSVEDCKKHIDFIAASPFHNGQNDRGQVYNDLKDIIFNEDKFHKRIDNLEKVIKKIETDELSDEELVEKFLRDYEDKKKENNKNATTTATPETIFSHIN